MLNQLEARLSGEGAIRPSGAPRPRGRAWP